MLLSITTRVFRLTRGIPLSSKWIMRRPVLLTIRVLLLTCGPVPRKYRILLLIPLRILPHYL
jgi:hypothetical protein